MKRPKRIRKQNNLFNTRKLRRDDEIERNENETTTNTMNVLIVNAGSSSLKFKLFHKDTLKSISSGIIEEIGGSSSTVSYKLHESDDERNGLETKTKVESHKDAFDIVMDLLTKGKIEKENVKPVISSGKDLLGVGHRVVHGGWEFKEGAIVDEEVIKKIEQVSNLAPLHNRANLKGIQEAKEAFDGVPQVAVFDTCYHQTLPPHAYMYAIPWNIYEEKKVRKYGFHGTSHFYLAKKAAELVGKELKECNFITLHLGNGASACAIRNGESIDTSMGLTPAEGLMMGTRAGDMDPTATFHMTEGTFDADKIENMLNKESGFKGICGKSDVREIQKMAEKGGEEGERAKLALDMFCYRIEKTVGSYYIVLNGRIDGVIFGGGIGEHAVQLRERIVTSLGCLGLTLDEKKNEEKTRERREESESWSSPRTKN
ncbi:acetate kinase [Planoprotostelium fungivorum]|uniref:Probable acetate kinase n=1 Tax=Planoprotostelium fungivorum TaxID=1890364 RepID=A0A2P6P0X2_9EUKA|nr:acetate kinase [Planoprotostelium fungivorum]